MVTTLLLCLLPLKHLVIANVLDWGYSRARELNQRHWWLWAVVWLSSEMVVTYWITKYPETSWMEHLPVLELVVMVLALYNERRALLGSELRTHIFWELVIMGLYVATIFSTF